MKQIYLVHSIFILFLSAILLISCSKSSSDPGSKTSLTINSLSVTQGPYNTVVVITGTGFNSAIAEDKVFFNGKSATVSAASSTQLTVKVPLGAGTGNVTLTINGNNVTGPAFTYQLSATVSTLAGNNSVGSNNGTGTAASFTEPLAIAVDANDNVYVADADDNLIRKVSPAGVVTTLAGSGHQGMANGTGTAASFNSPEGIAVDASGNVYVADNGNLLIRKITPTGLVTTFAGNGKSAPTDGIGTAASFEGTYGMTTDASGNIFVADGFIIRKITQNGVVSTIKNNNTADIFGELLGVAVDTKGILYVSNDEQSQSISEINTSGMVSLLAGSGTAAFANGKGAAASFNYPNGLVVDASGNVYVADTDNNLIRMITPDGVVSTLAGGATSEFGNIDGIGTAAGFNSPTGMAIDASGILYVADNSTIRKIVMQ